MVSSQSSKRSSASCTLSHHANLQPVCSPTPLNAPSLCDLDKPLGHELSPFATTAQAFSPLEEAIILYEFLHSVQGEGDDEHEESPLLQVLVGESLLFPTKNHPFAR